MSKMFQTPKSFCPWDCRQVLGWMILDIHI